MITDRGYTGHEHLVGVGLINMNGRLYDPAFHRFLSPDNSLQEPGNTQNYNRYGYCLNNPFKYTDENGELFYFRATSKKNQRKWSRKGQFLLCNVKLKGNNRLSKLHRFRIKKAIYSY